MLLAMPMRCGYQRLSNTPMGVIDVPALPRANNHAVEQERLPGALDQSHSDQTEGGNEHRDAEHGAGAEAVHGASHQGQGAGQEHHEHRHAQRQGAAAPLQVIGHRVKQQADHESRTAVEQQHKETHDEDETGGGSGVHNGVAG